MDPNTYSKLELDKILRQLAEHAAFSASRELLERLSPTGDLEEARRRQQETTEARDLLDENSRLSVGGARDVRPYAGQAARGITLQPEHFLEIKGTLYSSGVLRASIEKVAERYPLLAELAIALYEGKPLVAAITRVVSDQGEVLDSASPRLGQIRRDLRVARDRLHSKLQAIIGASGNAPYLQEALITQRAGRYVIPVKAESKGRIKGIVHDQSASGATIYIEPMATVEINNEIRSLEVAESDEVQRILHELSEQVGEQADELVWMVEALAALDAAFARAKYAAVLRANPPELLGFDASRYPGSTVRLYSARHPLIDPQKVVAIDAVLEDDVFLLVITGPNTGGKTVSLKTVGLLALMAQCGLHIPAAPESAITVFDSVYADIGDEQSIEQSLSTFSAHLTHIIKVLEQADDRSLVLLDELGAGTDPAEGAAIARAILEDLRARGVTTFVATHYPELKLYAHSTPGVRNASVEFDVATLAPTYRLIIGLPGRSNAIAIATRLGLPAHIVETARGYIGADDLAADDLLDEIHRTREDIRASQDRLSRAEHDAVILRDRLQTRLDEIEAERGTIIAGARAQAEAEILTLNEEIRELRKRLRAIPPSYRAEADEAQQALAGVAEGAGALQELIDEPVGEAAAPPPEPPLPPAPREAPGALQPGDRVYVPRLKADGEVVAADNGEVEIQLGGLRTRLAADDVQFRSRPKGGRKAADERSYEGIRTPQAESPGLELHLRGLTLDDALPMLDEYIDQAYMAGLPFVRIVHGKGAGILRKAVRDVLRKHPLVQSYETARGNEGGEGVTVAHLAGQS